MSENTPKRTCKKCNIEKNITAFPERKAPDGRPYRRHTCGGCKSKKWREKYPEKRKAISDKGKQKYKDNQLNLKQQLVDHLNQAGCQQCGNSDIMVLTFHHKDPTQKEFGIAQGFTHSYCFETLKKEAEKCEVLCANCHGVHHYKGTSKKAKNARLIKEALFTRINQNKCQRCGYANLAALCFHHIGVKNYDMSETIHANSISFEDLVAEALTCEVLCRNCHIIEHRQA